MPYSFSLKNAFKDRKPKPGEEPKKVPQMFTFLAREGLATICGLQLCGLSAPGIPGDVQADERLPRRLRQEQNGKDVFALVKQHMSDSCLQQDPLLVFPQASIGETEAFLNRINSTLHVVQQSLEPERRAELLALAESISLDFPTMGRAVQYYKTLCDAGRVREGYPCLEFVEAGPKASFNYGQVQLGQRPPPPRPHELQVVFHR